MRHGIIFKIARFFLGVFLFLAFFESLLYLGGKSFMIFQNNIHNAAVKEKGEYRILCLGESLTALGGEKSYPKQLEEVLNARQNKIHFTVINKGMPAGTTDQALAHIDEYLNEYQPDMVTSMIGRNDVPKEQLTFTTKQSTRFYENLRTWRLAKKLLARVLHPANEGFQAEIKTEPISEFDKKLAATENALARKPYAEGYQKLGVLFRAAENYKKAQEALEKAVALDPELYEAWGFLGLVYREQQYYDQAIKVFERIINSGGKAENYKFRIYNYLAETYKAKGDFENTEKFYKVAISLLPAHPDAYGSLGNLYLEQERFEEAEEMFTKQIRVNPRAVNIYGRLAHCFRRVGKDKEAFLLLKEGLALNPNSPVLYAELGNWMIENKRFAEAERVLLKGLELMPKFGEGINFDFETPLLRCYEEQGKKEEAQTLRKALTKSRKKLKVHTEENYLKISQRLTEKGVTLVAVQYPLVDIKILKETLKAQKGIFFVDNKTSFEAALAKEGFDFYFVDRFFADFGHCTARGNQLIAENIAAVILDQKFGIKNR
jgi:tetratricopeptide (TPR) repeat protein